MVVRETKPWHGWKPEKIYKFMEETGLNPDAYWIPMQVPMARLRPNYGFYGMRNDDIMAYLHADPRSVHDVWLQPLARDYTRQTNPIYDAPPPHGHIIVYDISQSEYRRGLWCMERIFHTKRGDHHFLTPS